MSCKKLILLIALLPMPYVCAATASLFYCALTNRMVLFVYPYLQWWNLLDHWSDNWAIPPLIIFSGLVGLLPLVVVIGFFFRGRVKQTRSLYGRQTWADADALRNGGIQLKRRQ